MSTTHAAGKAGVLKALSAKGVVLSVAGVAVTGALGAGAYAAWTASAAKSTTVGATQVAVTMVDANGGTFATGVSNMIPGDYFYRYVDVTNTGPGPNSYAGPLAASGDLSGQMLGTVESCSTAWTVTGGVSTCSGTKTTLQASTALGGAGATVDYGSIAGVQHVRYTFTFDASAPVSLMGKTGSISAQVSTTLVGGRDRTAG